VEIRSFRLNDKFNNLVLGDLSGEEGSRTLLGGLKDFKGFIFVHGSSALMEKLLAEYESRRPADVAVCFLSSSVQVLPASYRFLTGDYLHKPLSEWIRAKYGVELHSLTYPVPVNCPDQSIRTAFTDALKVIRARITGLDPDWLKSVWDILDPHRQSREFIRALEVAIAGGADPECRDTVRKEFLPALESFRCSSVKYSDLRASYLQACRSLGKKNFS
jgi:hypothetical protein